jgi:hypothetical protein
MSCSALLSVALAAATSPANSSPPFDFTHFEDTLFPAWRRLFLSGDGAAGEYSLKQGKPTSVYGATDMVYALHATGQLRNLSRAERAAWGATINGFQNKSTGFFSIAPFEATHTANPPFANYTWHASGAAVETLRMLSSADVAGTSSAIVPPLQPPSPFTAVEELLTAGPSAWQAFLTHWLSGNGDVWMGSQAVQSLAAVVKLTHLSSPNASAARDPFAAWLLRVLNATVDRASGMWDGTPHQDAKHQLGGAFHIFHVYQCSLGEASAMGGTWSPLAQAAVDTTLAAQHGGAKGSGTWGPRQGGWAGRGTWTTPTSCIDLDGVYSAARGAIAATAGGMPPYYRWADVKRACSQYLRTAAYVLNNASFVLQKALYAKDTHLMHGPMYAVAECQQHFPELVRTRRPWQRWTAPASCIYA